MFEEDRREIGLVRGGRGEGAIRMTVCLHVDGDQEGKRSAVDTYIRYNPA